ncbi:MAG: hypothetical protein FWG71_01475 [Synergistaceae bacterium]|nr:hypothetical protein [Synergistaceae bacterium]
MNAMGPVKFLYAADFRLDSPLALGEGGGEFAPLARGVAYEAARRLVDCALYRGVDFVLMRGELCDAYSGPKALLFLAEQTARLSEAGVACYILNEGAAFEAEWLAEFPDGVKWLANPEDPEAAVFTKREFSLPLAPLLESVPPPLQGLSHDESGPRGAWLIFLPDKGEPSKEFIELDVLRWESCEMDVTSLETEEALTAFWKTLKDSFRERERERSVLLHLKLTGVMKKRSIFYGEDFTRGTETLMEKLNADEDVRGNFVLVDLLSDDAVPPPPSPTDALEADFWEEAAFFKSGMDLRVGLLDALKERGMLKRVLASDAAPLLENMTESDVESLLKDSFSMANYWLFKAIKNAERPK